MPLELSEPVKEFAGFAGLFLASGAVGFRYAALRGWPRSSAAAGRGADASGDAVGAVYARAAASAATLGAIGTVVSAGLAATELPALAARQHTTVAGLLTGDAPTALQLGGLVLALVGFALAARGLRAAWLVAAVGVVGGALRAGLLGQWSRLVNPMHSLAGGLWIGTLLMLTTVGLGTVFTDEPTRARRGAIAADMVNGFSPLAFVSGLVVVLFGVITAWRHLHTLDALWTTDYGYALIAKLCVVAVVFGLGAWNWRRQRPRLGSDAAAVAIRRSSAIELAAATVVLLITAVLVSLPAPRPPRTPPAAQAG